MAAIMALARRFGLLVVEDAAQGMGVTFGSRHVGTFGEIGCLSFFADKTITTGEGGALLVNDERLAQECMYFKNQGRLHRGTFIHDRIGYNFRITDLQAAIGIAQFGRLREHIERKRAIRAAYFERLRDCPGVRLPADNGFGEVVPFRTCILVDRPAELAGFLAERQIATRRFFYPLHRQPSLNPSNCIVRRQPATSVRLYETGLMLPSGLTLTPERIDIVCRSVREFQETTTALGRPIRDVATALVEARPELPREPLPCNASRNMIPLDSKDPVAVAACRRADGSDRQLS
jgi:perosamine synthetase